MPVPCRRRTISFASVLTGSVIAKAASSCFSSARYKSDSPRSSASFTIESKFSGGSIFSSSKIKCLLPIERRLPFSVVTMPCATIYSTFAWRSGCLSPLSTAACTIACATGWLKCSSKHAAVASISSSLSLPNTMMRESFGSAAVRVPVLSNTTVSARDASSRNFPPLTRMPCSAASFIALKTASGAASFIAHEESTISVYSIFAICPVKINVKSESKKLYLTS